MRALLWKDCRLNRLVLVVGMALLLGPHVVGLGLKVYLPLSKPNMPAPAWSTVLFYTGLYSLVLSTLTVALLGGNAIAVERPDRSAEFLAYLPPTRRKVLASKVLLAMIVWAAILGLNLPILFAVTSPRDLAELPRIAGVLVSLMVLLFGSSWLVSSFLASPANATGLGVAATALIALAAAFQAESAQCDPRYVVMWTALIMGSASFVAGSICFLRRAEP